MQSLISNLRQQTVLSVLLATIVSNTLYSLWYQIPWVIKIIYGPLSLWAQPASQPLFGLTLISYINMLVAVIGLSLLIPKKGAVEGFLIGTIVSVFFSMNAFLYSFFSFPIPEQGVPYMVATCIGLLLFYAVPGTLLGYFRKN